MLRILIVFTLLLNSYSSIFGSSLPNSNVFNAVARESKFLWLGTEEGLIKYDTKNHESIIYTKQNSKLPSNSINSILIDNNGNKWLGTDGGLVKFNNFTWKVYDFNKKYPPFVIDVAIDKQGSIWALTFSNAIYKSSKYGFKHIEIKNYMEGRDWGQNNIVVDNKNNVWITSLRGLVKYDGNKWEIISDTLDRRNNYDDIYKDYNGGLWITQRELVYRHFKNELIMAYPLSNKGIEKVFDVNSKNILADDRNGLVIVEGWRGDVDSINYVHFTPRNSGIPSTRIRDVLIYERSLWICTEDGFAKYDGEDWTIFNISKFFYIRKN